MQELTQITKKKLLILTILIYGFSLILLIRLIYLQVVMGTEYYKKSLQNRTQYINVPAYRSIIYDRSGENKLAYNRKSISIIAIPAHLPESNTEKEKVYSNLSKLIKLSVNEIKNIIKEQALDKYTPIVIQYDLDPKVFVRFVEHNELYPGLYWENRPRRVYPLREKAAHIIGYTGVIDKNELKRLKSNPEYHSGSILGKMGIEKYYDEIIRGKEGKLERIVDAYGSVLDEIIKKEPIPGNPIVLSIDKDIQELAYELLGNNNGAVVVSKPATGEILALVSKASFDPNLFTDRFSIDEYFVIRDNVDKPFLNRAIQGTYPPSSIFKLVSGTAILANLISVNKSIHCPGYMRIGNRIFKCWETHGYQNFHQAIANSCDVYFYTMGLNVGREEIMKYAHLYGINKKSDIDLPGESTGLLPEMEWFKKKYKRPWQNGDTANISIGQGDLLITPIVLNLLTCCIVNHGIIYKPFLLKSILSLTNKVPIWEKKSEILSKINLPDEIFDNLKLGMVGVTTYGTARWIKYVTDIPIAGKTGTGEAGENVKTHALFTAFAPYNAENINDMIVVTVVVEHGGGGSAVAAPIAVKIFDYYFKVKNKMNFKKNK